MPNSLSTVTPIVFLTINQNFARTLDERIIGGEIAEAGHYPFIAAINVHTPQSTFFCGGTILTNRWILTAGQCVDGATEFEILVGTNKLDGDDGTRTEVATALYVLHPDYNPPTLENDVGLIESHMAILFTTYIRPVEYLADITVDNGVLTTALGWGQTSDGVAEYSNDLIAVQLITISNEECKITYGNQVTINMVCVVGNYNEGTCIGDSGSPLIHYRGYALLVGVSSFHSGNGCESTDPSGYTRIDPYTEWIRNITDRIG